MSPRQAITAKSGPFIGQRAALSAIPARSRRIPSLARLQLLERLLREARHRALALHDPLAGDNNWSLGCRIYARSRNALADAARQWDWLGIVEEGQQFIFKIGAVPVRFFHGDSESPTNRNLGVAPRATQPTDIERAAEQARIHWGLTADLPIESTVRVAENAGAVVVKFPAVAREIDALSINRPRPLIIRTSEKEKPTRLRFDIAHEIGHLILHGEASPIAPDPTQQREREADRFASAFLLPRKAFERSFPRARRLDWQSIFALKRQWNASAQAILRRA